MKRKKLIYVCSPFTGDIKGNIRKATKYSRYIHNIGHLPLCVHIYLEKATGLSEANGNRAELIQIGKDLLIYCDEMWIFGEEITEGMEEEIGVAKKNKIIMRRKIL